MAETAGNNLSSSSEICRTFTRSDVIRVNESSPREPYLSFTIGPQPLHRLVIRIWSHDQGWCNPEFRTNQPYENSHTWFALGIVPENSNSFRSPDEQYLCEIQRNVRASRQTRCHTLEWRLNTPFEDDQSEESVARGWLESISNGSCIKVGVFPRARYPGWVNVVYQVKVELYDDNPTAILPTTSPPFKTPASEPVDTSETGTGSGPSLPRQARVAQGALGQTLSRDPGIGAKFNNLAVRLGQRYDLTQSMDDLTRTIELAQEAINVTSKDHPTFATYLSNLGYWLKRHYERTLLVHDLTRLIEVTKQVVDVRPASHPHRVRDLNNLALYLRRRYEQTRSVEDLTGAIKMIRKAVAATADDDPERPDRLCTLGNCLGARYRETGRIEDLESAIQVFDRVVKKVPPTHPELHVYLSNLCAWLGARFEATGSIDDLERSIEVIEEAINITSKADQIDLARNLSNLGLCLGRRSDQRHSTDDLERAIELSERAIAMMSDNHPDLAAAYSNDLGVWLSRRFDQQSLARAIEACEKAVEATGDNHPDFAMYLSTLSQSLIKRYEQTGSVDDLTRAIEVIQKAVATTSTGHSDLATLFSNLSTCLATRYGLFGLADDLSRAIEAAEKAIGTTPHDHITFASKLTDLGTYLGERSRRTGAKGDLTRSIAVSEQAVMKNDPVYLAICLSNLGNRLSERYKRTGSMDDLERSIEMAQKAVEAASVDRDLGYYLMNLGSSIVNRYDQNGSMDDLNRAIEAVEKAVEVMDHDHIYVARYLTNLGGMLARRYWKSHAKRDEDAQLSAYDRAWRCTSAPISDRFRSANVAAMIYILRGEYDKAYSLLRKAILLLPKVSPRSLKQSDMQQMLTPTSGVATAAAAMALNIGKPVSEVLSILELGRGIIAGLLIDTRGDLSDLEELHPSLAEKFDALRKELESPAQDTVSVSRIPTLRRDSTSQDSHSMAELSIVNRRHEASRELDQLIERIQAQDGFHDFLQPPPVESLMAAAESGPVVVINVSEFRCDAILVERHTIRLLQLPDLIFDEAVEYVTNINSSKHNPWRLLGWLWTTVCKPCLDALGILKPVDDEKWPHVWWVPTGLFSEFPLHAAGIYTPGSKETVLDRVVSSYASSLKALQHGRRRRAQVSNDNRKHNDAILVAMEQTEGQMALPNAKTEIDKVRALCPSLHLNAKTPPRLKADILEYVKTCKVLHFAGHGESKRDPSQSCLLLDDWKANPLTVSDLRESWLQESPAFLAYLSACSTGSNRAERLSDEAIHLMSAFQLAGFRHVVGTLWEVSDPHCVNVATVLYQTLCDEGMTDEAVSRGLHRAVRKLRDDSFREGNKRDIVLVGEDEEPTPGFGVNTFWIPYIHFGA